MKVKVSKGPGGYLLLAPAVILVLVVIIYPTVYAVYLSFFFHKLIRLEERTFVGLANYLELATNPEFWGSIQNGLVFTFASVAGQIGIGLALAILLNYKRLIFKTLVRGLVILPWVMPIVATALVWRWMLNDMFGIVNRLLMDLQIRQVPVPWLADRRLAMASLIAANIWRGVPLAFVMILAALQGIPNELYEVAQIDGASPMKAFLHITLPLLKPVIFIIAILRTIWNFNFFDLPWVMTQGGPAGTTTTPPVFAYLSTFTGYNLGLGATIAVCMFSLLLILTSLYFMVWRPK